MTETKNIIYEMQEMQTGLYSQSGGKNLFFKKTQKLDIAKMISEKFDLNEIISTCIYILPGKKNEIYIDYTILKLFIHDDIHEKIIDYLLVLYNECVAKYGKFSLNLNLDGFTISAAERHKNAVKLFSQKCLDTPEYRYGELTEKIRIFNTPSIMETVVQMFKPFFAKNIAQRIELYKKNDSLDIMKIIG
jgi:hypothetical protein